LDIIFKGIQTCIRFGQKCGQKLELIDINSVIKELEMISLLRLTPNLKSIKTYHSLDTITEHYLPKLQKVRFDYVCNAFEMFVQLYNKQIMIISLDYWPEMFGSNVLIKILFRFENLE
jgi:hypothetical protein